LRSIEALNEKLETVMKMELQRGFWNERNAERINGGNEVSLPSGEYLRLA
jgi:hypothetical protein